MKKNILIIITILMLCSCSLNNTNNNAIDEAKNVYYQEVLNTYELADISGYPNVDGDSRFVDLTFEDCIKVLETGSGMIYIGSTGCKWCQRVVPELNKVATDEQIYILYVNASQTFLGSQYEKICELLSEYLDGSELTAPTVIAVENGVVKGFHKGVVEGFEIIDETSQLNNEQKIELQNIYKEMAEAINY